MKKASIRYCLFVFSTLLLASGLLQGHALVAEPTDPGQQPASASDYPGMARDLEDWGFWKVESRELRMGVMAHAYGPFARGKEYGSAYNLELRLGLPDWNFWRYVWSPRLGLGGTMNPSNQTDQVYLVFVWRFNLDRRWFLDFEAGGTAHNGELETMQPSRRQYGYPALFRLSLALNYRLNKRWHIGLSLDHISNGYLHRRNEGLDQTGLVLGFAY